MNSHNLSFCIDNPCCFWKIMAPFPYCRCPPSVFLAIMWKHYEAVTTDVTTVFH